LKLLNALIPPEDGERPDTLRTAVVASVDPLVLDWSDGQILDPFIMANVPVVVGDVVQVLMNAGKALVLGIATETVGGGTGGGSAWRVVAASDAPEDWINAAGYHCDGVADEEELSAAGTWEHPDLGPVGTTVLISPGTYYLSSHTTGSGFIDLGMTGSRYIGPSSSFWDGQATIVIPRAGSAVIGWSAVDVFGDFEHIVFDICSEAGSVVVDWGIYGGYDNTFIDCRFEVGAGSINPILCADGIMQDCTISRNADVGGDTVTLSNALMRDCLIECLANVSNPLINLNVGGKIDGLNLALFGADVSGASIIEASSLSTPTTIAGIAETWDGGTITVSSIIHLTGSFSGTVVIHAASLRTDLLAVTYIDNDSSATVTGP
jgi:hypothetical protein